MRQHVREFVVTALEALGLRGRAMAFAEVGSYVVEGQEDVALRPAVLEACPGSEYLGIDFRPGPGVDLAVDVCAPGGAEWDAMWGRREVVLCVDTLEHVNRPWRAVETIRDLLRPGGLAVFAVPFAFPIHEYPHDYYRYTQDGMRALLETCFRDVWTAQDPGDSLLPHTVVAVAKKIHAFTDEEKAALEAGLVRWRTSAETLMQVPRGSSLTITMSNPAALAPLQAAIKAVLGGETLEARYARLCAEPSDINEHLPTLRALAASARSVVELGTRGAVSTTALLMGLSESTALGRDMLFVDVDPRAVGLALATLGPLAGPEAVTFRGEVADSREATQVCDLLFVDTLHTHAQLAAELDVWSDCVTRRIALHDTTTFGLRGEDGTDPGLRQAWLDFLATHPEWELEQEYTNNNGLVVLRRK